MSRFAARKDVNHNEIEAVFRQLLADHVTNTAAWGFGAGDLFVSFGGFCCWIEIKRDAKAELTAHQIAFQRVHPHAVLRCETTAQAIEQCAAIRKLGGLVLELAKAPAA